MSKVDIAALEQRMLSGEPFTYREMKRMFTTDNDLRGNVHAAIIKSRDAGKIAWALEGGRPVWRAVKHQGPAR